MTDNDPPTTEFRAVDGDPAPPVTPAAAAATAAPVRSRTLRPWMWIVPAVILLAVAAFFGGRAVASSASTPSSAPQPVTTVTTSAPISGSPGSSAQQSAPITTPSGPSTAAGSGGQKTGKGSGLRASSVVGMLTSISGSTWTVEKADGTTVQVTITATTTFGTKAKPETSSEFKTGTTVLVVTGKSTAGQSAVTAKRVVSRMKTSTAGPTSSAVPTTA